MSKSLRARCCAKLRLFDLFLTGSKQGLAEDIDVPSASGLLTRALQLGFALAGPALCREAASFAEKRNALLKARDWAPEEVVCFSPVD